jgi:hypothetical protein
MGPCGTGGGGNLGGVGHTFSTWAFDTQGATNGRTGGGLDSISLLPIDESPSAQAIRQLREYMKQYGAGTDGDIELPTAFDGIDAVISWTSEDESVIGASGKINRPAETTAVKLTATADDGQTPPKTWEFYISVQGTAIHDFVIADFHDEDTCNAFRAGSNFLVGNANGVMERYGLPKPEGGNYSAFKMGWVYGAAGERYISDNPGKFKFLDWSNYSTLRMTFQFSNAQYDKVENYAAIILSTAADPAKDAQSGKNPEYSHDEILAYAIDLSKYPVNEWITVDFPLSGFVTENDGFKDNALTGEIGGKTPLSEIKSISIYGGGGFAGTSFIDWTFKNNASGNKSCGFLIDSITLSPDNQADIAAERLTEYMSKYTTGTVDADMDLPASLQGLTADISWRSDSAVISASGTVTRPEYTAAVTLTATVDDGVNPVKAVPYKIYVKGQNPVIDAGEKENGDFLIAGFRNYDTIQAWKEGTNNRNGKNLKMETSRTYNGALGSLDTNYSLPVNGEAYLNGNPGIFGGVNFNDYEKLTLIYYNSTQADNYFSVILSTNAAPSSGKANDEEPDFGTYMAYPVYVGSGIGWNTVEMPFSDFYGYGGVQLSEIKSIALGASGKYAGEGFSKWLFYNGIGDANHIFIDSITLNRKATRHEDAFLWLDREMSRFSGGIGNDISLPSQIPEMSGVTISWASSDGAVLSASGKLNRPNGTVAVTLTAAVVSEGITREKSYDIVVTGKNDTNYYLVYDAFGTSSDAEAWGNGLTVENGRLVIVGGNTVKRTFFEQNDKFSLTGLINFEFDLSTTGTLDAKIEDAAGNKAVHITADTSEVKYGYSADAAHSAELFRADSLSLGQVFNTKAVINGDTGILEISKDGNPMLPANSYTVQNTGAPCVFTLNSSSGAKSTIDNFKAYILNSQRLDIVKNQLTWEMVSKSPVSAVTSVDLFNAAFLGVKIEWLSSDGGIIDASGNIRFTSEEKAVTLTAKIYKEENPADFVTKAFNVKVPSVNDVNLALNKTVTGNVSAAQGSSFANAVDGSAATAFESAQSAAGRFIQVDLGMPYPFSLITVKENRVNGQYAVKNFTIRVSDDGNSWTNAYSGADIGAEKNIDFNSIVTGRYIQLRVDTVNTAGLSVSEIEVRLALTDAQIVNNDKNALSDVAGYIISQSVTLPAIGEFGSSITWSSGRSDIISDDGELLKTPSSDTVIILTATVKYGGVTAEKTFKHLVEGKDKRTSLGGGTQSGGGSPGQASFAPTVGGTAEFNENGNSGPVQVSYFNDLDSVPWAVAGINKLAELGAVNGDGGGNYRPLDNITREEFVKILVSALNLGTESGAPLSFKDCDSAQWYYPYLSTAVEFGLITGISEETFGVGVFVSRQDTAVILSRASETLGIALARVNSLSKFDDEQTIGGYAKGAVEKLFAAGIVNGDENRNFNPLKTATRAEAAKLIYGLLSANGEGNLQ